MSAVYQTSADKARAIVGDRKEGRPLHDFYPTPPELTQALLLRESFSNRVLEPACGDGAISRVLEAHGYQVFSSDVEYRGYGVPESLDFLNTQYACGDIVTNPPFKLANRFIEHAMHDLTVRKMALLMKLSALESQSRKPLLERYLQRVYVFSERVSFFRNGKPESNNGGMLAFAWFIFYQDKVGDAVVRWI